MRIEFTRRAIADLHNLSAHSLQYGEAVAAAVEARLHTVISRIAQYPEGAERLEERPGVHVMPLVRYPYKIFYRLLQDRVRILHIRHTARRPWSANR